MTPAHVFSLVSRGRIPQTVLLSGDKGCGKEALAAKIAAAVLCTGTGNKPCGACLACRKAEGGVHPDITVLDEGEQDFKVDTARRLRADVSVLPNESANRVFILHHVQRMNQSAQNALLKTLEEPPAYAVFLLLSEQPDALLPTILSRCAHFALAPDGQEEELKPGVASFLDALAKGDELGMLAAAMRLEKLNQAGQAAFLSGIQAALRDAAFAANGLESRLLPEIAAQTAALSRSTDVSRLLASAAFAAELTERLAVNAAPAATSAALCAGVFRLCYE